MTRKDGSESKERKGKWMRKKLKRGRNSRKEVRRTEVFWKVESKDDVEGGQQERRKVVENVIRIGWKRRERMKKKRFKEVGVIRSMEKENRRVTRT